MTLTTEKKARYDQLAQLETERAIENLLGRDRKENPIAPLVARLLAAGVLSGLNQFVNAERERHSTPAAVLSALTYVIGAFLGTTVRLAAWPGSEHHVIDVLTASMRMEMERVCGEDGDRAADAAAKIIKEAGL